MRIASNHLDDELKKKLDQVPRVQTFQKVKNVEINQIFFSSEEESGSQSSN